MTALRTSRALRPARTRRRALAATAALGLVLGLAACGDDDGGDDAAATATAEATADGGSAAGDLVPEEIAEDGTITVGTDSTYAPAEFLDTDGTTVVGFDIDLFDAVAAELGLEAEYVSAPFDNIIPGVESGEYEVGVSSFTINDERKEVVDMVSYFEAGTQWGTQAGNPGGVDIDNACGKRVAVQQGTVQVDDLTARSEACTAAGNPEITINQYQGQDQATAAVVAGQDDAMLADSPVLAYAVEQTGGQLELLGDIYDSAPYGYVVSKEQEGFADALVAALEAIIESGAYEEALAGWGVEGGGITDPAVNP